METLFSPSVNIARDAEQPLFYLPTPNAQTVFNQITDNYLTGTHCFTIVGAYGTGKSAFLWAFQQSLTGQQEYFPVAVGFGGVNSFRFEHFIGEYASLKQTLARHFGAEEAAGEPSAKAIIAALDAKYRALAKKKQALVLVIDEFGKFLEYAAKENPEQELYFIQQLAEYVNDAGKNVLLVSTVHQDISAYALDLSRAQRMEWEKVKGRLKELTFNEPVEQLLALAARQLATRPAAGAPEPDTNTALFAAIRAAHAFPLRDYGTAEMQAQVWPLELLSAGVLVLALQRYGQNERSLFSFLRSPDHLGLAQHPAGRYYALPQVYDYLSYHFFALLTSRYNPNLAQWASIRAALEKTEKHFDDLFELSAARQVVKTIGLLSLFASAGAEISPELLREYGRLCLNLPEVADTIKQLEQHKIIRYRAYKNSFILSGGTDVDIEAALEKAGGQVAQVVDVATRLREHFKFPYIAAKQVSFEAGTPRVFEVRPTDEVLLEEPADEVDGFVNLIFSEKLAPADLPAAVGGHRAAVLYGLFREASAIKNLIRELDKVKLVRKAHINDHVVVEEMDSMSGKYEEDLGKLVLDRLYTPGEHISWYYAGTAPVAFHNRRSFNRCLSGIAAEVYADAPTYRSELVNRTRLSTPILTARKNFLRALFDNWQHEDLDFPAKNFPPEKTIYLSLLRDTGMHRRFNGEYALLPPTADSFGPLWAASEAWLQGTQEGKQKISDLMALLARKPIKLKQGLIDFWVPVFLFMRRHEFALYGEEGKYIPELNAEVVDLFTKSPELYEVKAFELLPEKLALFNEYRELLQLDPAERLSNASFVESIKPFLTFYRQLPAYAQRTGRLPAPAKRLRESITKAKDPMGAFFDAFPGALGFNLRTLQHEADKREEYVQTLQHHIGRLRQAYPDLLTRLEQHISSFILHRPASFEHYQTALRERYRSLEPQQLPKELLVFRERLLSALDDRDTWLNSLASALLNKQLPDFEDADEHRFQARFESRIRELDNLLELSKTVIDPEVEELVRVGVAAFGVNERARVIRRPKQRENEETEIENEIRRLLGDDKSRALAILARLLPEYF